MKTKYDFSKLLHDYSEPEPLHLCDHPDCQAEALHRAPKNRHQLNQYYWYCLEHIKTYNKSWDYYKDMSLEEIEASRMDDVTWNRPSWPIGSWKTLLKDMKFQAGFEHIDSFFKKSSKADRSSPKLPKEYEKALSDLDLLPPVTEQTLKKQYKNLVKKHHPDKNQGDKKAEERIKTINLAYSVLKKYI